MELIEIIQQIKKIFCPISPDKTYYITLKNKKNEDRYRLKEGKYTIKYIFDCKTFCTRNGFLAGLYSIKNYHFELLKRHPMLDPPKPHPVNLNIEPSIIRPDKIDLESNLCGD